MKLGNLTKKFVSVVAAIAVTASILPKLPDAARREAIATSDVATSEAAVSSDDNELLKQSFELYPDDSNSEKVVTLEGLMPEGAEAKANEVTSEYPESVLSDSVSRTDITETNSEDNNTEATLEVSPESYGEGGVLAAYDIKIMDGSEEYQPGTENPILVEINDPVINENIELWHVRDDGTRERIFDFTPEEGKVSFYATGFSVYEIVAPDSYTIDADYTVNPVSGDESFNFFEIADKTFSPITGTTVQLNDMDDFREHISDGIYIGSNRYSYFFKNMQANNVRAANRRGVTIADAGSAAAADKASTAYSMGASKYYFEEVAGKTDVYRIYTFADDNETKKYLVNNNDNNSLYLTNDTNPAYTNEAVQTEWHVIYETTDTYAGFVIENVSNNKNWHITEAQHQGSTTIDGVASYNKHPDPGNYFSFYLYSPPDLSTDPYQLDGSTYGLINHQSNTKGNALMAEVPVGSTNSLGNQLVTPVTDGYKSVYGITAWEFEWIENTDKYKLSAMTDDGKKYLKLDSTGAYLADEDEASELSVVPNGDNKIKLVQATDNITIARIGDTSFIKAVNNNNADRFFTLVEVLEAPSEDPLGLDGNTYGIVGLNSSKYYAMASEKNSAATKLKAYQLNYDSATGKYTAINNIIDGWTFHWIDRANYYVTDIDGRYIKLTSAGISLVDNESDASVLTVEPGTGENAGKVKLIDYRLNRGITCGSEYSNTNNMANIHFLDLVLLESQDDPYDLNGKAYGLMEHANGSSFGNALQADDSTTRSRLYQLETLDSEHNARMLYVSQDSDITKWTFENTSGDRYKLKAGNGKYIKLDNGTVSLTDDADSATELKVIINSDNTICLKSLDDYIYFNGTEFVCSSVPTNLYFVSEAEVDSSDHLTYTAQRISVSDGEKAHNGQEVIVYTRIWDDVNKKYDFYAIDYNGSLHRVYAYGDRIMWQDDTLNTLLWKFTVYYNSDGTENGYYELQNTHSDKYLAPQLTGNQILSDSKVGILMPGRIYEVGENGKINYGEYYSNIIAWDSGYMSYAALAGDKNTESIKVTSFTQADSFYFAIMDTISEDETSAKLHEVETVDNTDYGITLKVIDFAPNDGDKGANASSVTSEYFAGYIGDYANQKGLLSESLNEDGHPTVAMTNDATVIPIGKDFGALFDNAALVNNLFINSIHESSGYFEFDSCQNFATLVPGGSSLVQQTDDDDNPLYIDKDGRLTKNAVDPNSGQANQPIYDFTVYEELGTTETDGYTRKHGQFLPYNYIKPGVYSAKNPLNLYSVLSKYNDPNVGKLEDDDPRKYEKLHTVFHKNEQNVEKQEPDCYLGMELNATFVQTPSGLDSWGHDVIFEFTGDDDFWLYVDGELVLDLGGIHSAEYGKVNFRTGKVIFNNQETTLREIFKQHYINKGHSAEEAEEYVNGLFEYNKEPDPANQGYVFKDYTTHEMKIYYMERGAGASNLHMRFNLSSVTPGNVLFAKTLSNLNDSDDMDIGLVQYPFQIFYKLTENDPSWIALGDVNDDGKVNVSYQNSTQTVRFASSYVPPSGGDPYQNVFFLIPGKNIEINFPDEAMYYYIKECAVNSNIYDLDHPTANNGEVPLVVEATATGNIKDLKTEAAQVSELPTIAFDNKLKDNQIHTLNIKKKLYDEHYDDNLTKAQNEEHRLKYDLSPDAGADLSKIDNTVFDFRLSFWDEATEKWAPADMQRYYVTDPAGYICEWNQPEQQYVRFNHGTDAEPVYVKDVSALSQDEKNRVTNLTSRFGAISKIPADFSVKVPGLIVGTKFKVEERKYEIPVGYDLIDFECQTALFEGTQEQASYQIINEDGAPQNSEGVILGWTDAYMNISNRRGFGLEADKVWSDADFTKSHGDIYFAVYKGDQLVEGTVRVMESPENIIRYFFDKLAPGAELSDYMIKEVVLVDPVVEEKQFDDDWIRSVFSYTSITPLENGDVLSDIEVTDKDNNTVTDDYTVSYDIGTPLSSGAEGNYNVRVDTVNNKRKGGLEINLYEWNTVTDPENADFNDKPLEGGRFKIYKYNSVTEKYDIPVNEEGFVSDSSGTVTVLYGFDSGDRFMVQETESPKGYIGMEKPVYFEVTGSDGNYTITSWNNENDPHDGTAADDDTDHTDGKNWAEYTTPSGVMAAKIDIYNKPFTFDIKKVDGNTKRPLEGAEFALYKDAMILGVQRKSFDPIAGFESLITDENGIIPGVDNTLPPLENKRYYLTEVKAPSEEYSILDTDIVFTVSNLGIINCENEELLDREEHQIGNTLHVTYTISIPNTIAASEYYFDIEKIAFLDKNVHKNPSDSEQKFIFKVDRFAEDETAFTDANIKESFYVSLNCDGELIYTDADHIAIKADGSSTSSTYNYSFYGDAAAGAEDDKDAYPYSEFSFDSSGGVKIKKTYEKKGTSDTDIYKYPATIRVGRQTVRVSEKGIYRITELTGWSNTDYDFWSKSNVYKGYGDGTHGETAITGAYRDSGTTGDNALPANDANCVYINVGALSAEKFVSNSVEIDSHEVYRPTASFTNSETEFAYLSSQAYATNIIRRTAP